MKSYAPAALLHTARNAIDGSKRIVGTTRSSNAPVAGPAPVLPMGIKIDQPHTGIGNAGGLAQLLQEPEK